MKGRTFSLARLTLPILLFLAALGISANTGSAQPPISWHDEYGWYVGGTGNFTGIWDTSLDCAFFGDTRWVYAAGTNHRTLNADTLLLAIHFKPEYFDSLPYALTVNGNPTGSPAPLGIPTYVGGTPCWWNGNPIFGHDPGISQAFTDHPNNPLPGQPMWRGFKIPLDGDSLAGGGRGIQPYFRFESDSSGVAILQRAVNCYGSGIITVPPAAFQGEFTEPETLIYFGNIAPTKWVYDHKMHFPQIPDSLGDDINFTYPKVLADDWICSKSGSVDMIRFWFSAKNDWFNVDGDLDTQIERIHVSIHDDIPDPDGPDGPLYSMPGDTLWSNDYEPYSPLVTIREFYPSGDQGWFDPNTGEYIPHDHTHIYECVIQTAWDYFYQEKDRVYWLDVSIVTKSDPPRVDSLLGWKTSDMLRYPGGHHGRHFLDDAVWGDFPYPVWEDLRDPEDPDSGESIDLAFVISDRWGHTCCDGFWGWGEWCGKDCFQHKGCTDLTHDGEVGLMDFVLFSQVYGGLYHPTADFDADGDIDLTDLSVFVAHYGHTVPNCLPADQIYQRPPNAKLSISFNADPNNIQPYIENATPGIYNVYVVVTEVNEDIDGLDFGLSTSDPPGVVTGFSPSGQFLLSLSGAIGDVSAAATSTVTGNATVGSFVYFYDGTDSTVTFDVQPHSINGNLMSVAVTDTAYRDISAVAPGSLHDHPYSGIEPKRPVYRYRLYAAVPNPFDNSTLIAYELAQKDQVRLHVYNVKGERVRSLVDVVSQDAGPHSVHWDGHDENGRPVAPGVYFYKLETGRFTETRTMTLIR
jgi:hypothetical protein